MTSPEYAVPEPFTQEAVEKKLAAARMNLEDVLRHYRRAIKHPNNEELAEIVYDIISASAVILHWRSVLRHWEEINDDD